MLQDFHFTTHKCTAKGGIGSYMHGHRRVNVLYYRSGCKPREAELVASSVGEFSERRDTQSETSGGHSGFNGAPENTPF
jgi:hypothetical protein